MSYFPMFVELKNKPCLVVGGGAVALRKVKVLKDFGAEITVTAPEIQPEIREMHGILCREREFRQSDLKGQELVVAATADKEMNHRVSLACKKAGIPVNAVDQQEDCSFIFPAYLKEGQVVAAFSSGGQSPVIAQFLKEQMRPAMTPRLGELADCLGSLRPAVKQGIKTEEGRKKFYRELLLFSLEQDRIPTEEEIEIRLHFHESLNI